MVKKLACIVCCLGGLVCRSSAQLKEPYQPLHGGSYSGIPEKESPDPLITYHWADPRAADSLQVYILHPKKTTGIPKGSFEQGDDGITVSGKGDLMFDFGVESAGWLEFDSDDLVDSVEASISEYNEPAIVNAGAQHRFKTRAPVKYGHTYRLELNDGLYEGVRFAWIHVKTYSGVWHMQNLRLVCQVRPTNYTGSFSCSDPELTRIWYTGAYTVKLNLLQDYFGAILMERSDRSSWTGDAYPAQAAALAAFGNDDMVRTNLVHTSGQDNGIPAYSLYWVLSLVNYFNYTGDSAFLKEYIGNADRRLVKAYEGYDSLPRLNFMGWDERLGAGFEHPQTPEAQNTYRMLCINVWEQFAKAVTAIGEDSLAEKYKGFAALKMKQMLADEALGHFGIHAVSEAINAGLGRYAEVRKLSGALFADPLNRLSYSPFNQYFIIQAMASAGQYEAALATIKDCWGGQLQYGGTTFFEVYRPSWNHILGPNDAPPNNQCGYTSLAHPWGAGVTQWLSENVLGIKPAAPGFKIFTIIPYLNKNITQVKGVMPTPFGLIKASYNTHSGICAIDVPRGTRAAKIGLPKAGRQMGGIRVNGEWIKKDGLFHSIAGISSVEEDSDYVYLVDVRPGHFRCQMMYSVAVKGVHANNVVHANTVMSTSTRKFNYAITSIQQDSITSGNWSGKYGKDGYMLFGYPRDVIVKKLPAYIDSVTFHNNGLVVWDSLSSDPRVLAVPALAGMLPRKKAAAMITNDPIPCQQTFTIDITAEENHPYRFSMYFLDEDRQQRRSAIEIFDLKTLNIIAPVAMVRHCERGKYVTFSFDRSVRIRIDQVRGKNVAVSGLFFN